MPKDSLPPQIAEKADRDHEGFALANCIRALSIDAVEAAQSGHPGAPMGMADAATALFRDHLKFDASAPDWPDRDRVVLSNGHASMLLYSLLHLTGYADMTLDQIRNFRQLGAKTAGHPEYGHAKGIETTTGPLGQGIASAVGMAMAESALAAEFADLVDHHIYVFLGDGCLQEGIGQEAISLAGHLGLGKLIVLYDDNQITIDGPTSVSFSDDVPARLAACGWHVLGCDGHDIPAISRAIAEAKAETGKPTLIAMKTVIGFGAPNKAGTASVHGAPLGAEEAAAAKAALGWDAVPFEIPANLAADWRAIGAKGGQAREEWEARLDGSPQAAEFNRRMARVLPEGDCRRRQRLPAPPCSRRHRAGNPQGKPDGAGRAGPRSAAAVRPTQAGRRRDTGSGGGQPFSADAPGRYVGYGVREFGMAAAMNGMSTHGGLIPYGGTFLVFSDYARNAIRLSALMGVGTVYVMTHDSIGLGEDGPTHQPVEHLASLRAIPNLFTFRPADAVETLECWDIAIRSRGTPSLLALSRQSVPQLRLEETGENLSGRGAYVIRHFGEGRDLTLLATGTEVSLAVEAAEALADRGLAVAVVSMPSWELFQAQSRDYRDSVLGSAPRIAVEAAGKFGWTRYVDGEDDVIGLEGFGASGPAEDLYQTFGITREAIIARAEALVEREACQ